MSCTSTNVRQPQASAIDRLNSPAINNIYKIFTYPNSPSVCFRKAVGLMAPSLEIEFEAWRCLQTVPVLIYTIKRQQVNWQYL